MRDGERYEGEFEAAAKQARLDRQRRLAQGWHGRGWQDPAGLLRELNDRYADPEEIREMSAARQRERMASPGWRIAYLDSMDELARRLDDVELMDEYERATVFRPERRP